MLRPNDLAKTGSEHAHQVALFAMKNVVRMRGWEAADRWAAGADLEAWDGKMVVPELKWFHAVPNGGSRGSDKRSAQIVGGMMVAEGATAGVADTSLPVAKGGFHGLYIEMKKPGLEGRKNGGCSDEQIEFRDFVRQQGYAWAVCYSWREAIDCLRLYLEQSS
jgi:hypothetical protein